MKRALSLAIVSAGLFAAGASAAEPGAPAVRELRPLSAPVSVHPSASGEPIRVSLYRVVPFVASRDGDEVSNLRRSIEGRPTVAAVVGRLLDLGSVERLGAFGPVVIAPDARLPLNEGHRSYVMSVMSVVRPDGTFDTDVTPGSVATGQSFTVARLPDSDAIAYEANTKRLNRFDVFTSHGESIQIPDVDHWTDRGFFEFAGADIATIVTPDHDSPVHSASLVYVVESVPPAAPRSDP